MIQIVMFNCLDPSIQKNQMEKNMENEVGTGIIQGSRYTNNTFIVA